MSGPGVALTTLARAHHLDRGDEMPERICSVEDCQKVARCRGLCGAHYQRLRVHGRLELLPVLTKAERFWAKVDKRGPDECWPWVGYVGVRGYATFHYDGRFRQVHRVAHLLERGPIPEGFEIDHVCHTRDRVCPGGFACLHRRCVNPSHLEAVSPEANFERIFARRGEQRPERTTRKRLGPLATTCGKGHEFTPENTSWNHRGDRECRTCSRLRQARLNAVAERERKQR